MTECDFVYYEGSRLQNAADGRAVVCLAGGTLNRGVWFRASVYPAERELISTHCLLRQNLCQCDRVHYKQEHQQRATHEKAAQ